MAHDVKYWIKAGRLQVGPYSSRCEAVAKFRESHPFKGKSWEANLRRYQIMSGYGTEGPMFDLRWHSAAPSMKGEAI